MPFPVFTTNWVDVARSNTCTGSLNIDSISGFQSGDFIGTTVQTYGSHAVTSFSVYLTEQPSPGVSFTWVIYQDNTIIYSQPFTCFSNIDYPQWVSTGFNFFNMPFIGEGSMNTFGVVIEYSPGDIIPIGIDTSAYHNFEVESVFISNNIKQSIDVIPMFKLICDPESIEQINLEYPDLVFPSPCYDLLHFTLPESTAKIEIYNTIGMLVKQLTPQKHSEEIIVSDLPKGVYLVKLSVNVAS